MKDLIVNTKANHEKWAELVRTVDAAKAAEKEAGIINQHRKKDKPA